MRSSVCGTPLRRGFFLPHHSPALRLIAASCAARLAAVVDPRRGSDDEPLIDPGRPIGLRLLALVGAASFLLIGVASLVPLLEWLRQPPAPPSPLDPRQRPVGLLLLPR